MLRILFFIPSLAGGGAEKVLVNTVNNLDRQKYDITVHCLFDVGVNKQFLSPDIKYKYTFKYSFRGNTKILKLFSPEFLYRWMIKDKYDIVVSFFQSPTTRIVAGCQDKDVKLVQWIHNEFHDRRKILKCYRNEGECVRLQKRFDANVYVADTVKSCYMAIFPDLTNKNVVLYNVVESDDILKKASEQVENSLFDRPITLISVGRMVAQKSFDRLLNIAYRLSKVGVDFKLLLLGTGDLESKLKVQVSQLGIDDRVVFLGYKTNPYKYVKNADLFICSSLHEGFSTAVTESLIVGTPVVTTLCSGMKELLGDNEYGVITENSEDALFEGVLKVLSDKEQLQYYKIQAKNRGETFITQNTVKEISFFLDNL